MPFGLRYSPKSEAQNLSERQYGTWPLLASQGSHLVFEGKTLWLDVTAGVASASAKAINESHNVVLLAAICVVVRFFNVAAKQR